MISYTSFWTWFWWIMLGALLGGVFGVLIYIREMKDAKNVIATGVIAAFLNGAIWGIFLGAFLGFLSSLLINFLHPPYSFFINLAAEGILVIIILTALLLA